MKKHIRFYILMLLIVSVFSLYGCGADGGGKAKDGADKSSESAKDDDTTAAETADKETEKKAEKNDVKEASSKASSQSKTPKAKAPKAKAAENAGAAGLPEVLDILESDDGSKLVIVNKQYTVSSNYVPIDMVAVDGKLSTNQGLYFKREAYDAYLKMLADAKSEGINFLICSTYRSYSTQKAIYNNHIASYGVEYTNTVSAYPGRSEHHTGWAVDITSKSMGYGLSQSFVNYPEGKWINQHCSDYGFIIRYPKGKTHITGYSYEPWHLRYVGVDVAKEITSKGLTLEEYLGKTP